MNNVTSINLPTYRGMFKFHPLTWEQWILFSSFSNFWRWLLCHNWFCFATLLPRLCLSFASVPSVRCVCWVDRPMVPVFTSWVGADDSVVRTWWSIFASYSRFLKISKPHSQPSCDARQSVADLLEYARLWCASSRPCVRIHTILEGRI